MQATDGLALGDVLQIGLAAAQTTYHGECQGRDTYVEQREKVDGLIDGSMDG